MRRAERVCDGDLARCIVRCTPQLVRNILLRISSDDPAADSIERHEALWCACECAWKCSPARRAAETGFCLDGCKEPRLPLGRVGSQCAETEISDAIGVVDETFERLVSFP